MRSKILKWSGIALAVLFLGIQFIRPEKTNPPIIEARTIQAHTEMTPEVAAIFRRTCQDCYSHNTRWPWYSHVAPVSWFVTDHVNHGRKHLNLSDWMSSDRHGSNKSPEARLEGICQEVSEGKMPLGSYLLLHPDAKLSEQDVTVICDWVKAERRRLNHNPEREASLK